MKKHFADEFAKPTTISDTQKKIFAGKDEEKCPNCEGQLISECLFDFFRFYKKPTKNLTNFCPVSKKWSKHKIKALYIIINHM